MVVVRAQDVGLSGVADPALLEWSATNDLAVLTHDVTTMTRYAHDRVRVGKRMPGVFKVSRSVFTAVAIEDILLLGLGNNENEWEGRVIYLPLQ
ncbi:MAG: hypothetical protein WCQ77_03500 [Planctomycetota bacterium]